MLDFTLIFLPIIVIYLQKKKPHKELGLFITDPKKDFLNALQLFAVILALSFLISVASSFFYINDTQKVYDQVIALKNETPVFLAYLLVVRVISEEVFFRGFLVKQFNEIGKRFLTQPIGAIVSSVIFGVAHAGYGSIVEVGGAIILGFVLAQAFEKNKTLVPNILAHFFYNLTIVLII